MRKLSIAGVALTCGTIIAIGWQMGVQGLPDKSPQTALTASSMPSKTTAAALPAPVSTSSASPVESPTVVQPSAAPASVAKTTQAPAPISETVDGDVVPTRYGDVQVSVQFTGKTITAVNALKLTDEDRKSVSISNRAAPILQDSVLRSQSANVDTVSGATYTSDAYLQSLQSAIDKHNA